MKQTYRKHPAILETDLESELVALNGDTGQAFRLNASARTLWLRLPASVDELVEEFCRRFSVGPDQARADVDRSIRTLVDNGLIVEA